MRDEHGLTALDKAKERLEDSQHREVVALLENPAAATLEQASEAVADTAPSPSESKDAVEAPTANEPIPTFVRNDALVRRYLTRLLPLFCRLYTQVIFKLMPCCCSESDFRRLLLRCGVPHWL